MLNPVDTDRYLWSKAAAGERYCTTAKFELLSSTRNRVNRSLDRGHLIALASGGGENVNLVPQASRLNRGWSEQGRRWRSLKRYCASTAGAFIFVTVLYDDLSDIPSSFLYGIEGPGRPWSIHHFDDLD